jgi:hypothetical protein
LAQDKIRKHDKTPEMMALEKSLTETLGTRVLIENRPKGGRVHIEFFSPEDLSHIAQILAERNEQQAAMSREAAESVVTMPEPMPVHPNTTQLAREMPEEASVEEDLYAVSSFSV